MAKEASTHGSAVMRGAMQALKGSTETLVRVDRVMQKLDKLSAELDAANPSTLPKTMSNTAHPNLIVALLAWPDGSPSSENFAAGLPGDVFHIFSPDGRRAYVASKEAGTLVGFRADQNSMRLEEFCRIRLGLQEGGISSVAVGGPWVFAACGRSRRVVVLRLCHDWYQNRTRLLVMRVMDGGLAPTAISSNAAGTHVCVSYAEESLIRFYQCSINGKLDLVATKHVEAGVQELAYDESTKALRIRRSVGWTRLKLKSIFEPIQNLDMVPV